MSTRGGSAFPQQRIELDVFGFGLFADRVDATNFQKLSDQVVEPFEFLLHHSIELR